MRELRTQENKRFEKFFDIVRKEAAKTNCIFFVDCGEGREIFTDSLEGEDLSGWLIPEKQADKFEPEWKKNKVSDKWDEFIRFAIWDNSNHMIHIAFKEY